MRVYIYIHICVCTVYIIKCIINITLYVVIQFSKHYRQKILLLLLLISCVPPQGHQCRTNSDFTGFY